MTNGHPAPVIIKEMINDELYADTIAAQRNGERLIPARIHSIINAAFQRAYEAQEGERNEHSA